MSIEPNIKRYTAVEILSLVALMVITFIAIKNREISMFYLIYLFWLDEFIKSVFDVLKSYVSKHAISHPKAYRKVALSRIFMLGIYLVFIIVFFGFIIDWNSENTVIGNLEVLLFKNPLFNVSVGFFVIREIAHLYYDRVHLNVHHLFSKGMITLHVSIILGVFLWALFSGKFGDFNINLDGYQTVVAIVPFLIIKLIFECLEIKSRTTQLQKHGN